MITIFRKHLLSVIAFFSLLIMHSCNNDDKKAKDPDEVQSADAISDETYVMKFKSTDIEAIFNYGTGNEVKQLIFTWKIYKKKYALEVYGADEKGKSLTNDYSLEIVQPPSPTKNPYKLKRNPQEITRGDIKNFLGLARGTPDTIPNGSFKDMYFRAGLDQDPKHPGKNLMFLFYADDLTKLGAAVAGAGVTKPSPPALPCDTSCDD